MTQPKKETRTKRQIQDAFLRKLEVCGNITMAAKTAKVDRRKVYQWREADAKFRAAFLLAQQMGIDMLEDEVQRHTRHRQTGLPRRQAYRQSKGLLGYPPNVPAKGQTPRNL
ncbi:hypothetical protein [Mucilaginibacter pedocola]|uniref:hypothetical protein n=1 Tax=Mucilaginibacter pedocola TaxID=1792845 RepID=UPI00117C357D|nr:hypothetical protein [Mucilaginibacter pedocola]